MSDITTSISLVHPASNAVGVILADQIWVIFNQEMDEFSIKNGNFFITGPDTDTFVGPDFGINLPEISASGSDDQFASPGFEGFLSGEIAFKRINLLDLNEYTGPLDTSGLGNLWRTKAIFTPKNILSPETEYSVYLSGDENSPDALVTGVRTRTVFDPISLPGNTGTGSIDFSGTYTGLVAETYHVKVTNAGASGVAWFVWWKSSSPLVVSNPILSDKYKHQEIELGVSIKLGNGSFAIDDEFTVLTKPPTVFSGNTFWIFTSGTGSIISLPTTTATSIIGDIPQSPLAPGTFLVTNISPKDRSTNLPVTTRKIVITFNSSIDASTITSDTVQVTARPVNGDETLLQSRQIYSDITVSGSKLIIDI